MTPTLALACALIERPSVTPDDAGCQRLLGERLRTLGFHAESIDAGGVTNTWLSRPGHGPLFCFAGHTDVVPTGPLADWNSPPFVPTLRDGRLHGRGAADMKGGIAAFVTALERFLDAHPAPAARIALLITSDEEGPAVDGTRRVIEHLQARGETIDWCLVGEPSSTAQLGDTLRHGRRGSLNATLRVRGVQGHVAYPDRARNPIHAALPALLELCSRVWDTGNADFPPTSFQISSINAGAGATNVIPGQLEVRFNLRFSTEWTADALQAVISELLARHGVEASIDWQVSALPFLTRHGALLDAARESVRAVTGLDPELSTAGGTSDGRFIAPTGAQVVELGPINASIHQIDEWVGIDDLERLSVIYEGILWRLLAPAR